MADFFKANPVITIKSKILEHKSPTENDGEKSPTDIMHSNDKFSF